MHFEELVKKISPKLKGIVWRLSGRGLNSCSDDLYQEAMVHLWGQFQQGALADKTDSYILQGCYFYLKNYLRTHRRKAVLVSLEEAVYGDEGCRLSLDDIIPQQGGCSVRDIANTDSIIEQINNNGLTSREKDVFNLALTGLTIREIGAQLGISHVRVVKLQKKIREKCKKHLDIE
jgi:RNA polymerase sigma factor (sigma-70 family)